jgi:uncharacterized protein
MAAITPIPIFGTSETFYVPQVQVYIAGQLVGDTIIDDVLQVTYNDSVNAVDTFSLEINNWDADYRQFKFAPPLQNADVDYSNVFTPGNSVELWMGYQDNLRRMMSGTITSLQPQFSQGAPPTLTVGGQNEIQNYRKEQHTYSWTNMTDTAIAQQLCGWPVRQGQPGLGLPIKINPASNEQPETFVQMKNQYDITFLLERARHRGYEMYMQDEGGTPTLFFGLSKNPASASVYQLEWGKSLISFTPTLSTAKQVGQVTVRGWDRKANAAINETCNVQTLWQSQNLPASEVARQTQIAQAYMDRTEVITDVPMHTTNEAQAYAQSVLSKRNKQAITASVTTVGLPDLRAGSKVEIIGFGVISGPPGRLASGGKAALGARGNLYGASSDFDGEYYVTQSTHTIGDSGYQTQFSARREGPVSLTTGSS